MYSTPEKPVLSGERVMGLMARREPQAPRPTASVVVGRPTPSRCSSAPPTQEQDGTVPILRSQAAEAPGTTHPWQPSDCCHFSLQAQAIFMIGALLGALSASQGVSILPRLLATTSPACAFACPAPRRRMGGGPCASALPAGQAFWASMG